jgi:beta-lactamase regulating signal transducer with metallopeptidase domain
MNWTLLASALRTTAEYLANGLTLSAPIFLGSILFLRLFFRGSCAATRYRVALLTFLAVAISPLLAMLRPVQPANNQPGIFEPAFTPASEIPGLPDIGPIRPEHASARQDASAPASWLQQVDWPLAMGILWIGAVLICSARLVLALIRLRYLHLTARPLIAPDGFTHARKITIARSFNIAAPMAIGLWSPKVLLPADFQERFSVEDQRHVLRHEIAHLERFDDWLNLALQLIIALLPINLFLWSLKKRLHLEQEIACDDWAVSGTRHRKEYAKLLTRLAAGIRAEPDLVSGVSRQGQQLYKRVARILDEKCNRSLEPSWRGTLFAGLSLILFSGGALFLFPGGVWISPVRADEALTTNLANKSPVLSSDVIALLKSSALNDTDTGVRRDAVAALANSSGDEATSAVLALLDESKDEQLKVLLLRELNRDRVEQAKVKEKLNQLATREQSVPIRVAAIGALARNLDDSSIDNFISIYRTASEAPVKQSCLRGLAGSSSKTAKDFLMSVVKGDPDPVMRRLALRAVSDSIGKGVRVMIRTAHPLGDGKGPGNFGYMRVPQLDDSLDEMALNPGTDLLTLPLGLAELQEDTADEFHRSNQLQGKIRVLPRIPPEESESDTVQPTPNRDDK